MNPPPVEGTLDANDSVCHLNAEMVELTLLLPSTWLVALEKAAAEQGLTTAQLVRILIRARLRR